MGEMQQTDQLAKKPKPDRPLMTEKQKAFVMLVAGGTPPGKAAIEAGYSEPQAGYKLMRKQKIVDALNIKMGDVEMLSHVDAAWTLTMMRANAVEAMEAQDFRAARAQLRDIGEHLRMYPMGREVIIKPPSEYSDAEMLEAIRQLDDLILAQGGKPADRLLPPLKDDETRH